MTEIFHVVPGNVLYSDPGRQCPDCEGFFSSSYDMMLHRRVCPRPPEWRKSDFEDGVWILPVEKDLKLKTAIIQNGGSLLIGDDSYSLNQKGTIIKRRRV